MIGWFCLLAVSSFAVFFFLRWKKESDRFAFERRKFAHDLQSPIAALRALGKNSSFSDNERALLSQSITRLSELAGISTDAQLKQENAPELTPLIELPSDREIWVIDDDISIHQVWKSKNIERSGGPLVRFFTRVGEAETALASVTAPVFCLVDQEFTGEKNEGFQFLRTNHERCSGVLVTSHADEHELQQKCVRAGIRLVAKCTLHRVQIRFSTPRGGSIADAILIDDDALVRLYWSQFGKKHGLHIETFETPQEFEAQEHAFASSTRLFIDSSLGNGVRGEELSERYAQLGFREIYLTTGFDPDPSLMRPWIRAIFGKTPEVAWFRPTESL